ncbi:hypothetical protein [Mycobacterium talmoniae]|uniref:Secreted protein n=1 Tax=Mycobacterium talmoniae TaxID=1858794 RepID=A0A1S1NJP1_9MYCO|nr:MULTISPECIES: hypothetical protein [Mycobacterium]OHV04058.1 hypothetical protein BKN37_11770 [Mycobacterium talmoniae]PQM48818.1 hypothetical protein C1Y40_00959 [Mycobacterium talmoniae]TDH49003.1 hypothetical protein E2F47_21940 [Mycobacterium eburneum]
MTAKFVAAVAVVLGALVTAPPATAAPAGFPDVDAFTSVDPQGHFGYLQGGVTGGNGPMETVLRFATSDGVLCMWNYFPKAMENDTFAWSGITCSGNIPGIPDSVPDNGGAGCARVYPLPVSSQFVFDRHWGQCPPFPSPLVPALDAGQKLESGNATCVVGANQLIACIDPARNQGFVLQPSGSWVF